MAKKSILNSQELDDFEKELQSLGIINTLTEESIQHNHSENKQPLSSAEERAWMLHQQDPLAASGPFAAALKLIGNINLTQLSTALTHLYQGDSNLNVVYALDNNGELSKTHNTTYTTQIDIIPINSDDEAINFLLQKQSIAIDLATQPAIKFWLLSKSDNEVVLAILGHHILLDDSAWKPIFTAINCYYQKKDIPLEMRTISTAANNVSTTKQYWADKYPQGFTHTTLPAHFYVTQTHNATVHNIATKPITQQTVKAHRYYTDITTSKIETLSITAQASAFQTLLTLFGLYLNQLFEKTAVDLLIPVISANEITNLNQIESSSNVIPVTITNSEQSVVSAITELRNNLLNGIAHNLSIEQIFSATKTPRHSLPNILVTQIDDASNHLKLDDIEVTTLAVPPIASDYDITLAIQFEIDGHSRLELTTGDTISSTIGAFLLEQFVAFIEKIQIDDNIAITPLFSRGSMLANNDPTPHRASLLSKTMDVNRQFIANAILGEFKNVLNNQEIDINDDFFELGGHSLLATRVIGKLKTLHQIDITISDFFSAPSAYALADFAQYSEHSLTTEVIPYLDEEIIAPLSLVQKSYMATFDNGRNSMFNIPFTLKFSEQVNENAFHQAFTDVITRHHALRTLLIQDQHETVLQRVIAASSLNNYQWFFSSATQGASSATELLAQEANYSFDLFNELPLRVRFVHDEQGQHYLCLLIYHSIFDEWSTSVLFNDLFYAYSQYVAGKKPTWETAATQFHQYALAQNQSDTTAQHLQYWLHYLGKVEQAAPLFYQQNKANEQSVAGDSITFSFTHSVSTGLNKIAKINKSSLFHVIYAAISLAVYYLSSSKKLLVGTSTYGRDDPRYQDTVGLFTNVILNQVKFSETLTVNELISQVKNDIHASLPYSDVPFVNVEQAVAAQPLATSTDNLCEVYIQFHQQNILNTAIALENDHNVDFELLEPERNIAKFGLHFEAYENPQSTDEAIKVILTYRKCNYSSEQAELIRNVTETVFHSLAQNTEKFDLRLMDVRKALTCLCL
ncbi:condensation domain-containing protein [Pseudoalteromonas arctica]|uniref:Peptide synthetase n=1 Tax=Pseudoalteromonas arctica TaxID=394751 RepID=A0A7Y0DQ76_9GAMM|nr:condensation domain-containing protein [Pseudoalteromonas arctica]NMM39598.1 peptide synthetase [Pseudoalteromonas arctica]